MTSAATRSRQRRTLHFGRRTRRDGQRRLAGGCLAQGDSLEPARSLEPSPPARRARSRAGMHG
eukprot:6192633-Pleurochrysis_carterae.AAC.1